MTQNFTIQSSVAIDTATARAELASLQQDYDALKNRILQPLTIQLNTPNLQNPNMGGVTFQLDTNDAQAKLARLGQDFDALKRRIMQPIPVNLNLPNGTGSQNQQGGQNTPINLSTTQAHQALALLLRHFEAVRQRMTQPIPVTINTGGAGGGGGAPAPVTGGSSGSGGFGIFGGVWAGIRRVWSVVNFAWSGIKTLLGGVGSFFSFIGRGITNLATTPFRLLTSAINSVASAFNLMKASAQSVMSLLAPAGDLQQRAINMEVLLDNPVKAKKRLDEIEKYAKETNFNPGELIEASNLMQAFGIHGNDLTRLKLAGDAANAMSKNILEVVTAVNYLGSGRGGEAFEALARIGVTRDKLKPYGVQFNSQGALVTDTKKALDAVFKYFKYKFNKATERQADTWKGALQQAGGEVTYALSHGFEGALKPFTQFVSKSIIPAISRIGDSLKKIDWEKTLAKPLGTLKKIVDTISTFGSRAIDPNTRGQMFAELKLLGTGLMQSGKLIVGGLLDVGKALLKDLGATLENFTKNGVFPALASTFWNMGKTVLFGFLDAGRLVLSGFSDKFKSDMLMAIETLLPGGPNTETNARKHANSMALADLRGKYGQEINMVENALNMQLDRMFNSNDRHEIEAARLIRSDFDSNVAEIFLKENPGAQSDYNAQMAKHMGWSDGSTKKFESKAAGALKDAEKSLKDTIGKAPMSVSTKHIKAAGKKLINETLPAAATPFNAFFGEQQAQAKLKGNFNKANTWADKRIKYLDEEIEKKEKEARRERKRIIRGRGSYDTLNSIESYIGSLQTAKVRTQDWQAKLDANYAKASNAQSMRYQQQERQRQRRPASPGMQQEGQPRQSREATSVGNIELNTASTAKNIFLLYGAINRFLTRQNGLEKTLKQVLEVDYA